MKKVGKLLSVVLALSIISSTAFVTTASAAGSPSIKSDTTMNFNIEKGATYTFKLTPINTSARPIVTTANQSMVQVVSSTKSGNDYFVKIKAVGSVGDCVGIYTKLDLTGQKAARQLIVTITDYSVTNQSVSSLPADEKMGLYGIIEGNHAISFTKVGVLQPIRTTYSSDRTLDEHINAILDNETSCDIMDGGFSKGSTGAGAAERVIQDYHTGKFGLSISAWRKSKSDNTNAGILNGVLSAMVYFSGHDSGEALFAWIDAANTGNSADSSNFGFKDVSFGSSGGTIQYKDGTKIDLIYEGSTTKILFNE